MLGSLGLLTLLPLTQAVDSHACHTGYSGLILAGVFGTPSYCESFVPETDWAESCRVLVAAFEVGLLKAAQFV